MGQRLGIPKNDWSIETFFVGNQRSGLKEAHTDVYVQSVEQGALMRSQIAGNKLITITITKEFSVHSRTW
jgi:hypothetical protein